MRVRKLVLHGIVSAMVMTQSRTQYLDSENVQFWENLTSGRPVSTMKRNNQFWERLTHTHTDTFWSSLEQSPKQVITQRSGFRPKRQNTRQKIRKPKIEKRQTMRRQSPQVLMTECPLNTRCVSRNFCDNNGMVTSSKHNDFDFEDDKRGFIACVDSGRNVLGVCCVDLVVMLTGQGRPVRQDDVFKVESSIDLDTARQSGEDLGPFVVINIAADNANIDSDVRDNKRVETNRDNTRARVTTARPRRVPTDFLADNPFIGGGDDVSLSPSDVMTILTIMNNNRNKTNNNNFNNNFNNNINNNQPVFTTCPAATLCVDRNRCDFNGVITSSSIPFNPRIASMQVALDKCTTTGVTRPRRQSEDKVCCRDPNKIRKDYDDEDDYVSNYDFNDDMFNIDYGDTDQVYVYNMKTPYKDRQQENGVMEKLRKKKRRRKKKRPSQRLEVPENERDKSKRNRDSLDFFTNG